MLGGANIKLAAVTKNITGVSGREIAAELVAGSTDAAAMANPARGKLRAKIPELEHTLEERSRLARDLHDSVTQMLFSSSLIAEVLPRLWERDPGQAGRDQPHRSGSAHRPTPPGRLTKERPGHLANPNIPHVASLQIRPWADAASLETW